MNTLHKVALIGGTGKAGSAILHQLIEQNIAVKLLLRNPNKINYQHSLVEIIEGDVQNLASLNHLLLGCTAVISALGNDKDAKPYISLATKNIVNAMKTNNIQRFICITGITLDAPLDKKSFKTTMLSKLMFWCFKALIVDKQMQYTILHESKMDWTMVRIPFIKASALVGEIDINLKNVQGNTISAHDLAAFIVTELQQNNYVRQCPFVSNKKE